MGGTSLFCIFGDSGGALFGMDWNIGGADVAVALEGGIVVVVGGIILDLDSATVCSTRAADTRDEQYEFLDAIASSKISSAKKFKYKNDRK